MMVSMLMGDVDSLQVPEYLLGPGGPVQVEQLVKAPLPAVQNHVAVGLPM
jgi:hypothetical protein